ncbi:1,3-beta-glucanase [Demequina sp. TTPB684]|uniref:glycosyl hydrolase n=1 Tax=unclassified Demequina TaxID=2620311 RepID=UPI001CF5A093|nr:MULTISPECIES: glycosyl hydrolase [unclassified Demequina]MCB2412986.1 1,3-beta-glucanase [Demequina sp. TTPB684]UPU88329.1 glycosyl hydrolase [Demequina sp. TMPB413]
MTALARSAALALASAMALSACSGDSSAPSPSPTETASTQVTHAQVLEQRTVAELPPMRLADGVIPPTNRWYSSLAFGEGCLPVYPRPLSFRACNGGFSMGLTKPVASENAIIAAAADDVTVTFDGADGLGVVSAADSVGATLAMGPAVVTIAQGWPAIGITADEDVTAQLSVAFSMVGDNVATATVAGTEYGVVLANGSVDGTTLTLESAGSAALFAVPDGIDASAFASALGASPPTPKVSYGLDGFAATTTVSYGSSPTVVAMPAARAETAGLSCALGTYATIDGPFVACATQEVSWQVPRLEPSAALDLTGLGQEERAAVLKALEADAAADFEFPADSYFGSKALYRLANLVQVADALGETALGDRLAAELAEQLRMWGDPDGCAVRDQKCLVYDPVMRGVVGLAPSFGSEEFNDHHFHYGYLLYAAAVAGARDASLAEDIGPAFDLLADDIASPVTTADFPQWRSFDPVAGHSWASGFSPFADGNNQESSSEAVAAWNAVALWRSLRGDDAAAEVAEWMLSAEAEAARRVFLEPDLSAFPEFTHHTVGIQWGSKRDFATWFSAEPNAIIGIQLIPSPPMAVDYYSLVAPETVTATLESARGEGSGSQFADFLLMYAATQSPADADAAWEAALELPEETIDDGNSRAYMLAWIAALRD